MLGLRSLISLCFLISRDLCFLSRFWHPIPDGCVSHCELRIDLNHFPHPGRDPSIAASGLTTERESECPFLSCFWFLYGLPLWFPKSWLEEIQCVLTAHNQGEMVLLCDSISNKTTSCWFPLTLNMFFHSLLATALKFYKTIPCIITDS